MNGKINEWIGNDDLSVEHLSCFKYAKIASCDLKINFYKYKSMLWEIISGVLNSKSWNWF